MPTDDNKHDHSHAHEHEEEIDEVEGEEGDEEEDDGIVILTDAEGNELEFYVLDVIDVDDEQFALLTPADEDEESESSEIFIFHYEVDEDGGESFAPVEDEELFATVRDAAEALFAGEDDN